MQQLLCIAKKAQKLWSGLPRWGSASVPAIRLPVASEGPGRVESDLPLVLGLQGGGALGAFTWGVLDRLLEEPGFRPRAVSGASAGAMNAVVMSSGWIADGARGARDALERFWLRIGSLPSFLRASPGAAWFDDTRYDWNLSAVAFEMARSVVSPYEFNPLNHNPLRAILADLIDFERLRTADAPRLFVSATDVETGRPRIFANRDLGVDAVLASACLPHLFQAVEIDGRAYWDGGFTANPPLAPLAEFAAGARTLLVAVTPSARRGAPRAARDIARRVNEILGAATQWRDREVFEALEIIEPDERSDYSIGAKYNNDWAFIRQLRESGRRAAERWTTRQTETAQLPVFAIPD